MHRIYTEHLDGFNLPTLLWNFLIPKGPFQKECMSLWFQYHKITLHFALTRTVLIQSNHNFLHAMSWHMQNNDLAGPLKSKSRNGPLTWSIRSFTYFLLNLQTRNSIENLYITVKQLYMLVGPNWWNILFSMEEVYIYIYIYIYI